MADHDVFLSHYSGDEKLARRIDRALRKAGLKVWFDGAEIKPGDSIPAKINDGIARSRFGLVLLTPGFLSNTGGFRWGEVDTFLAMQFGAGQTSLVPVLAGVTHNDLQATLPLLVSRRYERLALTKGAPTAAELDRLAESIRDVVAPKNMVPLMSREEANTTYGGLEERIPEVREQLLIAGNDCKAVVESKSAYLRRALARGVEVKILCVDPKSDHAVTTLAMIDPRFDEPDDFIASMIGVERVLKGLRESYPKSFDFRYLPVAPSVGLFICDPGLPSSFTKIELYTPKPWQPVATRPHIVVESETTWADYFHNVWLNYWGMARVP